MKRKYLLNTAESVQICVQNCQHKIPQLSLATFPEFFCGTDNLLMEDIVQQETIRARISCIFLHFDVYQQF